MLDSVGLNEKRSVDSRAIIQSWTLKTSFASCKIKPFSKQLYKYDLHGSIYVDLECFPRFNAEKRKSDQLQKCKTHLPNDLNAFIQRVSGTVKLKRPEACL